MREAGSVRKLSSGSETVIGDEDDDGFVNVRASSLSLLLAIVRYYHSERERVRDYVCVRESE